MSEIEITKCEPGVAYGAFDLRNRGLQLMAEVTVWPRYQTTRYVQTTGREPSHLKSGLAFEDYIIATSEFYRHYTNPKSGHCNAGEELFIDWISRWRAEARLKSKIKARLAKYRNAKSA